MPRVRAASGVDAVGLLPTLAASPCAPTPPLGVQKSNPSLQGRMNSIQPPTPSGWLSPALPPSCAPSAYESPAQGCGLRLCS